MSKLQSQVIAFHRLFNQSIAPSPSVPDKKTIDLRVRLIAEEAFEIFEALYGSQPEWEMCQSMIANVLLTKEPRVDLAKFADGCGDLDFVVEGSRLAFGVDGESVADAIATANLEKVGGKTLDTGKIAKPGQWSPPDIEGVLTKQASGELMNVGKRLEPKCAHCGEPTLGNVFVVQDLPGEFCSAECANFRLSGKESECDHGVVFDYEASKGLDVYEVRKRWPRGWFTADRPCPKGCGFVGIAYASTEHYTVGDW